MIVIACFVLVVALAFGALWFVQINMKTKINSINQALAQPEVAELQDQLNISKTKNELFYSYITALKLAKEGFSDSRIIDAELLKMVSSAMPKDVKMNTLNVSPQDVQIMCSCTDIMAPAILTQALRAKGIFSKISYGGITSGENDMYYFSMTCIFGDK